MNDELLLALLDDFIEKGGDEDFERMIRAMLWRQDLLHQRKIAMFVERQIVAFERIATSLEKLSVGRILGEK